MVSKFSHIARKVPGFHFMLGSQQKAPQVRLFKLDIHLKTYMILGTRFGDLVARARLGEGWEVTNGTYSRS